MNIKLFKDLIQKNGLGFILAIATFDAYRRQFINDSPKANNNILGFANKIQKEKEDMSNEHIKAYDKINWLGPENLNNTNNKTAIGCYKEAAEEHKIALDNYNVDPSDFNKNEIDRTLKKLYESYDEIKKIDYTSPIDYITSLYNSYSDYFDTLTPDKIVCLFNIVMDYLILSSFLSVLSIMLSENIINKITFLEKYPRILKLIKYKNYVNKKVAKIFLFIHLIIIISGILGNIYMFFI